MKNRRYRGGKLSEYKLKKLVECFAQDMTVKDTTAKTRISEPTVRTLFMRIRQRIFDHGFLKVSKREGGHMPARYIFGRKHRGVPERYAHLYEAEVLHRIFATKRSQGFRKYSASNPDDMKEVRKLWNYNQATLKYDIIEQLADSPDDGGKLKTRPFEMSDYKTSSTILINEFALDPHDAFFRFIWKMLLKYPL